MLDFYLTLLAGLGLTLQLPAVIVLMAGLRIVHPVKMRAYRKHAILVIVLGSAVIRPTTDPLSLALVVVPLYAACELGIAITGRFARPSVPAVARTA